MSEGRTRAPRLGTPELTVLAVLALLVAGALLLGGRDDDATRPERTVVSAERLARVERRVEELRGLRFRRPVKVEVLTPAEVRAFGVSETEKSVPSAQAAATEELMKLLGSIRADVDLDAVTSDVYGEQVAGFYDPRSERMALVEGVGIDDVTLAHELTHALEDQHFDLDRFGEAGSGVAFDGDGASAEQALVEGTATVVMTRYLQRHPEALTLGDAAGQLWGSLSSTPLPPAIMRSLLFSYEAGERFVDQLSATTGDWRLVDNALRYRPPRSTAEIYDPQRWLRFARAERVAPPAPDAAGPGWRRLLQTTFGAYDLRELLRGADGEQAAARRSELWRGGSAVLWRRGPLPAAGCAAPCRSQDAFSLRIRAATPAGAAALAAGLQRWLVHDLGAVRVGGTRYEIGADSAAAVTVTRAEARVALAPDQALAARLLR